MAYVTADGSLAHNRPWSPSRLLDLIFGIVNFVICFFRGMFHLDDPQTAGQYGRRPAGQSQRRNVGGVRRFGGVAPPPCMGGG